MFLAEILTLPAGEALDMWIAKFSGFHTKFEEYEVSKGARRGGWALFSAAGSRYSEYHGGTDEEHAKSLCWSEAFAPYNGFIGKNVYQLPMPSRKMGDAWHLIRDFSYELHNDYGAGAGTMYHEACLLIDQRVMGRQRGSTQQLALSRAWIEAVCQRSSRHANLDRINKALWYSTPDRCRSHRTSIRWHSFDRRVGSIHLYHCRKCGTPMVYETAQEEFS